MDYSQLVKKIIELRMATRRVCMCEEGDKALLSLKTKMLFIVSSGDRVTPQEIMSGLKILKPNLAAMSKELEDEGLILRTKSLLDRRGITYSLTPDGEKYLRERLGRIAQNLKGVYDAQEDYDKAERKIDDVLDFLSFLQM